MIETQTHRLASCRFEILTEGARFAGIGKVHIGDTLVRSGRLPISVQSQTFAGLELKRLDLLGVDESGTELRVRTRAIFRPLPTKALRDHSFDPIHDTADWERDREEGEGELDIVIRAADDTFNGVPFSGFAYHYEYRSANTPIYWLMDRASWELDGDACGVTVVSQSACSDPLVTFDDNTAWTTEGIMHWEPDAPNPIMTHNLPRWASHGAFDFQYRGDVTLAGVFEHLELIRTLMQREPGKAEVKVFDKHIFDQTTEYATSPKKILLNTGEKSEVDQRNLWTWMCDEVHERARAEVGLKEEPVIPYLSQNYWDNFTIDTYYEDMLPAAIAIGAPSVFIDNVKKSAMTARTPYPGVFNWNMCCGHEYEIAPELGGNAKARKFVERCREHGIWVTSWTNNDQALSSPINRAERAEDNCWYVLLEDTRQKYGGAYMGCMSILDMRHEKARRYFVETHARIREETGLSGYLFDSFYNLGFMPVNYANGTPRTMWRELLLAFKELQDADVHFRIESFGPFGQVQHGCPTSYAIERCWVCYKVNLGTGYTTVPGGQALKDTVPDEAAALYYTLAHMTNPAIPLFREGKRIDELWGAAHKQALADYKASYLQMQRRYLQEDGLGVLWHDKQGKRATLWNFTARKVRLTGTVQDATAGRELPASDVYALEAQHTYVITAGALPTQVTTVGGSEGE